MIEEGYFGGAVARLEAAALAVDHAPRLAPGAGALPLRTGDAAMAKPGEADGYTTLDEVQPRVDFASYVDQVGPIKHRYRVPGHHFILVERGRVDGRCPDGRVEAVRGDLICFPATDLNEYGFTGQVRFIEAHIHFAPPPAHRRRLWLDGIGPLPLRVTLGPALERMLRVFETVCLELPQAGAGHRARIASAAWEMIGIIADAVRPASGSTPVLDVWQRARMRLSRDLGSRIEIRALAAEERISTETLIRGFRRRFGVSPGQYRAQQKLLHAAQRLRSADVPIKTVARDLGFADAYSFSRAFRKYLGILPSQLRAGQAATPHGIPDSPLLTANLPIHPPDPEVDIRVEARPRTPK